MFCPKCGKENPQDLKSCRVCGFYLGVSASSSPAKSSPDGQSDRVSDPNGGKSRSRERPPDEFCEYLLGQRVADRYTIEKEIGRGGMGNVYLATDELRKVRVALKFIHPKYLRDRTAYRRFIQEANVSLSLSHPSVIRVYDIVEWKGRNRVFLAMEYLEGITLHAYLKRLKRENKTFDWKTAFGIARQVLQAVGHAHSKGIIHRDLKPGNIMLARKPGEKARVVVMDFGIAKMLKGIADTDSDASLGTPHYMAPEQYGGAADVDVRADIYSLGVIVYEMLTGKLPMGRVATLGEERPDLPPGANAWVFRALEQNPENRYASATEMLASLKALGGLPDDSGGIEDKFLEPPVGSPAVDSAPAERRAGCSPSGEASGSPRISGPAKAASKAVKTLPCTSCGEENEPPFVFCAKCGSTGLNLGRFRVTYNLSLTFAVIMGGVYFRDFLYDSFGWNWPLYLLIAVFFTQFTVALARGRIGLAILVNWWCALFLLAGLAFFFLLHRGDLGIVFIGLADVPHDAIEKPVLYGSVLGGVLLLGFFPIYLRWGKRYGYVNAYRIILLALLAVCVLVLVVLHALQKINDSDRWADALIGLDVFIRDHKAGYTTVFVLLASVLARLFLFEIVIFSALRGLVVTRSARASIAAEADLQKEGGFTRSVVHIARAVNRFILILENMVRYLFETLLTLVQDLAQVALAFVRELLVPTLVLSGAAVLCHTMTFCIDNYIFEHDLDAFLKATGALAGMMLCAMIFLACKTPVSWRRTAVFYLQLLGWLLPNLLVFFLLLSVSLYLSSVAYNRVSDGDHTLPFRMGILTKSVGGLLLGLIAVTLIRKRAVLFGRTEAVRTAVSPASFASDPRAETPETAGKSAQKPAEPPARQKVRSKAKGLLGALKARLGARKEAAVESFRRKSKKWGLDKPVHDLFEAGKDVTDRLRGKPGIAYRLEQILVACEQKMGEIRALEATRGSISPGTYAELSSEYELALEELTEKRDKLQVQVDKMVAEEAVKKNKAETDLKIYTGQTEEAERLFAAGGVSEKDHRKRTVELNARIQMAEIQLKNQERILGYLSPLASRGENRPTARPPQ